MFPRRYRATLGALRAWSPALVLALLAGSAVLFFVTRAPVEARTSAFEPSREVTRSRGALAAPAAAKRPKSVVCVGLANYEIVRSGSATASCSDGNRVLGGACNSLDNGMPSVDGTDWECPEGSLATAICALICSEAPPKTGACCNGDGECMEATAADCAAAGGTYLGDDTECVPDICAATGACCVETEDLCVDGLTEQECTDMGGVYVGDDVRCDEDPAAICFGGGR